MISVLKIEVVLVLQENKNKMENNIEKFKQDFEFTTKSAKKFFLILKNFNDSYQENIFELFKELMMDDEFNESFKESEIIFEKIKKLI
jgi:hypothetical protein